MIRLPFSGLTLIISVLGFSSLLLADEAGKNQYSGEVERNYETICGACHLPGGYGFFSLQRRLGPDMALLHERDNLTPEFIRHAVRQGFLAMPRFTPVEVTDDELESIINYLTRARE